MVPQTNFRTIKKSALTGKKTAVLPNDVLRFVPLGGLEEIGRNMMCFEYRNEIIIIDMGLQFPEEETPGIDYIIPNISYLEPKKQNIKAVILTHAHYDHIGALPYLMQKLGNPPIYTTSLTKAIVLKRQSDFPNAPKLNIEVVKNFDRVTLSKYFGAEFFGVSHSIPDATGIILKTPIGNLAHCADLKIDYDEAGNPINLNDLERVKEQKIHTLFLDSTNAEIPGISVSERTVEKTLEDLFRKAEGRIIIGTFASLLGRIAEIIKIAERLNRKVFISGYSMKTNVQIAQNLGYFKIRKDIIQPLEELHKYKDSKILILSTGAQGEPNASLMKIVNGEHKFIKIKRGDTIIFSSSIVPGNERSVQGLKDNISRQGAKIYHSKIVDIHSSGHATQEELKTIIKLIRPKFLVPIHGYYFMRFTAAELAVAAGIPPENTILMDNGQIAELSQDKLTITDKTVDSFYVMVDGLGIGDVEEVVLRDRRVLAQEGMVVIIATLDRQTGRLLKNPDIISRGFIYLRQSKELLEDIRHRLKGIIARLPNYQPLDADYLKSLIRDQIGQFLYNKTKRRPMVLPVVIEV